MKLIDRALHFVLDRVVASRARPIFPIEYALTRWDEAVVKSERPLPYVCNVCGKLTRTKLLPMSNPAVELRENLRCQSCGASNRNRQIATIVCRRLGVRSLAAIATERPGCAIYNTEASWAIHDALKTSPGYVCSEYLGDRASGEIVEGVMHQDITRTSFEGDRFDVVLTSDVLEHVPHPLAAFREIHRILKPGGSHVFTVPFYQDRAANEARARLRSDGSIEHLEEPQYHVDPIRPEGALVYNIFALQLLADIEPLGFETAMFKLHDLAHGIVGQNALVFESIKRPATGAA